MTACPKQPCYWLPHTHYPDWLRMGDSVHVCQPADGSVCGQHFQRISIENVLLAWKAG